LRAFFGLAASRSPCVSFGVPENVRSSFFPFLFTRHGCAHFFLSRVSTADLFFLTIEAAVFLIYHSFFFLGGALLCTGLDGAPAQELLTISFSGCPLTSDGILRLHFLCRRQVPNVFSPLFLAELPLLSVCRFIRKKFAGHTFSLPLNLEGRNFS